MATSMVCDPAAVMRNVSMPRSWDGARMPRSIQQRRSNAAPTVVATISIEHGPGISKPISTEHGPGTSKPISIEHGPSISKLVAGSISGGMSVRPKSTWAASLCDHLEMKVMSWAAGENSCENENAGCFLLEDNYAPVEEMAPTSNLPITGTIPACLNGHFLRNGPNPKFAPIGGYHWFDGDGMIHSLKIDNGKATYAARHVRTSRLQQEEHYGAPKFMKIGDLKGIPGLYIPGLQMLRRILGVLDLSMGDGTGNTALIFHNKKLLALHERDRPYSIKLLEDGDLQTINQENYGQKLQHPFTAHPKIDPITGEMFIFTYKHLFIPTVAGTTLIYRIISKDGIAGDPVTIKMPRPVMVHDFAITENFAIFMDNPLHASPWHLLSGDFVFKFDPNQVCRVGILPRYARSGSHIQWFQIPPCFVTHNVNAWEEGDEVVLLCCKRDCINLIPDTKFKTEKAWGVGTIFCEYRMNLKSGEAKYKQISDQNQWVDFPRINPEYTGRKMQYAYFSVFDEEDNIKGIAKYNLSMEPLSSSKGNKSEVFLYGPGRNGEEAIFVPSNPGMEHGTEDDGYLISFVHNANTQKSEVVVIDAKTMDSKPIASVKLPRRVPRGLHAHFVPKEQLLQQA